MTWISMHTQCGLLGICALPVVLTCGCLSGQAVPHVVAASTDVTHRAKSDDSTTNRDHLIGWYAGSGSERVIPIFKHDETYYSVCRGFEIPFKESPDGLEWALSPSSMTGTTIGFNRESGTYYLAVFDEQGSNFSDGRYGCGEKEPLTRIDEPSWLLDATATPPHTNDDFLGWYQPIWFPYMRWEVRKEANTYLVGYDEFDASSSWQGQGDPHILTPLPEGLGFTGFERRSDIALTYNAALRRFELTKPSASGIAMPLARIPPPSPPDSGPVPPLLRIGIPSWH